ncbi:hypothetical protein [Pseudomonas benzenivorans]|uniref:hypothetical protein n=1 Tax=Pseudomonas benzenivorans TaxID=556533 RepID=UPI003511D507
MAGGIAAADEGDEDDEELVELLGEVEALVEQVGPNTLPNEFNAISRMALARMKASSFSSSQSNLRTKTIKQVEPPLELDSGDAD